jgi:hypothetical protein
MLRLLPQIQFVDQLFVAIRFCPAQIIKQASALCHHLEEAAPRGMIFPVGLQVLGQMLDPAGEKRHLHIRAAGIFIVQLKLPQTQRFRVLCHFEAGIVGEECRLASALFPFSFAPK